MNEEMLTTGDVARRLGVTINTVKRWAREGRIEAVLLPSGHHRIPRAELERLRRRPPRRQLRARFRQRQRGWERAEAWRLSQAPEGESLEGVLAWVAGTLELAEDGGPLPETDPEETARRIGRMHRALASLRRA